MHQEAHEIKNKLDWMFSVMDFKSQATFKSLQDDTDDTETKRKPNTVW